MSYSYIDKKIGVNYNCNKRPSYPKDEQKLNRRERKQLLKRNKNHSRKPQK